MYTSSNDIEPENNQTAWWNFVTSAICNGFISIHKMSSSAAWWQYLLFRSRNLKNLCELMLLKQMTTTAIVFRKLTNFACNVWYFSVRGKAEDVFVFECLERWRKRRGSVSLKRSIITIFQSQKNDCKNAWSLLVIICLVVRLQTRHKVRSKST